MSAISTFSTVFDDPSRIAEDLVRAPSGDASEAVAFLFCDSRIAYPAVLARVQAALPCPVTGGTTLGFPFSGPDGAEISAALLVFQKQGLKSATALSGPLDPADHQNQMRRVFAECRNRLGTDPALILPFFPLMPGIPTAFFIDDLFELAEQAPVFGGVTTHDLVQTQPAVFSTEGCHSDRMVLVMLSGVRPALATANQVSPMVDYAPQVTQSQGNEVLRIEDESFCDYMRSLEISPEDRINGVDALMQYGPTPVLLEGPAFPESDVPEVRCISYTNLSRESATFSGPIPEGTRLRMSILRQADVSQSTTTCLEKLRARMAGAESDGYRYSAVFCVSCVARYFVMVGGRNTEGDILSNGISPDLTALGFYAFCEIGPSMDSGNRMTNRSHSASIALCAI